MADKYTVYAIGINATIIDQIQSRSFDLGHEVITLGGDGSVDDQFAAIIASRPRATLTTTAIAKALTVCGFDGLDLSSGCDLWFQKLLSEGKRAGTLAHVKVSYSDGMLLPRRLSAQQGQVANYELEVIAVASDGVTAPHSITTGATLTGSPSTSEAFTLGPVSVNGSALAGVSDVGIDFGIEEHVLEADGGLYPKNVSIMKRRPKITIQTTNIAELTGSDFQVGDSIPVVDTVLTLYKLAEGGALAGSGDKTITIDEGMMVVREGSGDDDSGDTLTLEIIPTYDGTNDSLVIA